MKDKTMIPDVIVQIIYDGLVSIMNLGMQSYTFTLAPANERFYNLFESYVKENGLKEADIKVIILSELLTLPQKGEYVHFISENSDVCYYSCDKYEYTSCLNGFVKEYRNGKMGLRIATDGIQKMTDGINWADL